MNRHLMAPVEQAGDGKGIVVASYLMRMVGFSRGPGTDGRITLQHPKVYLLRLPRRWMRHGGIDFVFFAAHPFMGPSHSYKTACEEFGR